MFRDDRQAARTAKALLTRVRLGRLFTEEGPTREACDLLEKGGGPMSHGEAIFLSIAFDLWNGMGHCDLGDAIGVLDSGNLVALGSLLVAVAGGAAAVDRWIGIYGR